MTVFAEVEAALSKLLIIKAVRQRLYFFPHERSMVDCPLTRNKWIRRADGRTVWTEGFEAARDNG